MEHEEIRGNFNEIFKKLDRHGNKLTEIETRTAIGAASVEQSIGRVEMKLDEHNKRLTSLEGRIITIVTVATVASALLGWLVPVILKHI